MAVACSSMSVTFVVVLLCAVLLSISPAAEAYGYSSCARYKDSAKQALCQQLLAQLQQGTPGALHLASDGAGGVQVRQAGDAAPELPTGLASKRHNKHQQGPEDEPWQQEEEEEGAPWYNSRGPEYGYGGDKPAHQYKSEGDTRHGYRSGHSYPPTPSIPLTSSVATSLRIDLTPKTSSVFNATGRLTQNAFSEWGISLFRTATVTAEPDPDFNRLLAVQQFFKCEAPVTFDYQLDGNVQQPTSLAVRCKMVPAGTSVLAGAKFPWAEALQPANEISIPQPSELDYIIRGFPDRPNARGYTAAIRTIESPVAFTGSIVDLLTDALLNQPSEYAFEAAADTFVAFANGDRGGSRGTDRVQPGAEQALNCGKVTSAVQKVLCQQQQQQESRRAARLPEQVWRDGLGSSKAAAAAGVLASDQAELLHRSPGRQRDHQDSYADAGPYPPKFRHSGGKEGAHSHKQPYYSSAGDGDSTPGPAEPSVTLIPQPRSDFLFFVEASDAVVNATGDLTNDDFISSGVVLRRSAVLSDELLSVTELGLSVRQTFACVNPVKYYFSGPVSQPLPPPNNPFSDYYIRIQCRMEAELTQITVGGKFPWAQASDKRNQLFVGQPQTADYFLRQPPALRGDYEGVVASMTSQIPFTGSIQEFLVEALAGKPAGFAFEAYVTRFSETC